MVASSVGALFKGKEVPTSGKTDMQDYFWDGIQWVVGWEKLRHKVGDGVVGYADSFMVDVDVYWSGTGW